MTSRVTLDAVADAIADAVAEAAAQRRVVAVALLGLTIPTFGLAWAASAAFVAAALVAGERPGEARWTALGVGLVACAAAAFRQMPTLWPENLGPQVLVCALAAAAVLGAKPRSWAARAVAAALVAAVWWPGLRDVDTSAVRGAIAVRALATALVLLLAFADRPWGRLLVIPTAAVAVWYEREMHFDMQRALAEIVQVKDPIARAHGIVFVVAGVFPAVGALACGVVGRALARAPARDADGRWVLAVHRAPWWTSLVVAQLAFLVEATALSARGGDAVRAVLLGAVPAAVILGAQARVATSPFDALAPLAAASTLACASIASLNAFSGSPLFAGRGLVVATAAVLWTFAVCRFFDAGRASGAAPTWIWPALVVVSCALAASDADAALPLAALLLVPFVAQYVVASARPAAEIAQGAALLGVACSAALSVAEASGPMGLMMFRRAPDRPGESPAWWWPFALCIGVALAALAARRVRSITLVPADHPSHEWLADDGASAAT